MKVIHYGHTSFDKTLFKSIENTNWVKPNGGLWTSPIDSDDGWKRWCESEMPHWVTDKHFVVELKSDAKVYTIDTLEDLKALPMIDCTTVVGFNRYYPDYEAIAAKYDAIHLTSNGQWNTRMEDPEYDLYGWDVETVLILNSNCIK